MKKGILFHLLIFCCYFSFGQVFSKSSLFDATYLAKDKFESYIASKGFLFTGTSNLGDTVVREYIHKGVKQKKVVDTFKRSLNTYNITDENWFTYFTTSPEEYYKMKSELIRDGFFCTQEKDSLTVPFLLYQKDDLTARITKDSVEGTKLFGFTLRKQFLPKQKDILFAEDLSAFDSHEYLRFYFGEKNVKKDFFLLNEDALGKCSVLFPNTNRQILFLWEDEINNYKIKKMYIGGQFQSESSMEYDKIVAENLWLTESGIHAGMSLYRLRVVNDEPFKFYGGNSPNTGMVLPDSSGKINFYKENVILGCMNCNDVKFIKQTVVNSDDAINRERILFIHTIILEPSKKRRVVIPSK